MRIKLQWVPGVAAIAFIFIFIALPMLAAQDILFDNTNKAGVQNGPSNATIFRLDTPRVVTYIMTYHYFNDGKAPGSILLIHSDGTIYGPWQAKGRMGQGGVIDAIWEVYPDVELKPGMYLIIDSDFKTWSRNAESGNQGHALVKGKAVGVSSLGSAVKPGPIGSASGDLTGEWEFTGNNYPGTMMIAVHNGSNFSGKLYAELLEGGVVAGSVVSFSRIWQSGNLRQDFTGVLGTDASGRMTMNGTFSQNGSGSYTWSATKKTGQPPKVTIISLKGVWDLVGNGHPGPMDITIQNGDSFSGTLYAEKLVEGRISGTTVSFTRSWGGSSLRQDFTGTIAVDGSGRITMSGTFSQNGAGSYPWTAKKK
jgi:hypothetical protein